MLDLRSTVCFYGWECQHPGVPHAERGLSPAPFRSPPRRRSLPGEPLLLLCLASSQISLAASRRAPSARNAAALRGAAALHSYARARAKGPGAPPGLAAEAEYNLGRGAHEMGLLHLAAAHYERALLAAGGGGGEDSEVEERREGEPQEGEGEGGGRSGAAAATLEERALREGAAREAAHNLVHIYRRTGAPELARQIMARHLVF